MCLMPTAAPWVHKSRADKRRREAKPEPLTLREIRIQRGYTQRELADLTGMHRNSIQNIERGLTKEITAESAQALTAVLKIRIEDLGLRVRAAAGPASIQLRKLTAEQRRIIDELLALPAEDYEILRTAIADLRAERSKRTRRKPRP